MSRSYKYPIFTDYNKGSKQIANRKVRKTLKKFFSFSKGNWYRKIYNSWNICDYTFFPMNEEQEIKASRK